MKKYLFKSAVSLLTLTMIALVSITSCNDDEPDPDPILVEDGLYIRGAGTALTELSADGLLKKARNEVLNAETTDPRETLYEMYIPIQAGSEGFNIVNVVGGEESVWGPGSDFAKVAEEDVDVEEPQNGLWKGSYMETEDPFTVPEDGFYHVVVETELGIVAMARVNWGLIGGATPGGWSEDTELTESAFDLNTMSYTADEVTMLENDFKFRYSGGWKIFLDSTAALPGYPEKSGVRINTNFGGSVDNLVPGGDNIANAEYAVYDFDLTWTLEDGYSATQTFVREGEPLPEYPEELYMIGASIGGWTWADDGIQMIPVHSNPHVFWKIVYIESGVADAGVKFAPEMDWGQDFGVNAGAGETDGVWEKGSDNLPDVAESGYYMVVVNLLDETIEVNDPKVYGIGDAFGTWDAAQAANLFTVDNTAKTLTSPVFAADGNLRMHVTASTLTNVDGDAVDWWQAEFNVIDGNIEYRGTGGDQAAVPVTQGQTVTLDFTTETGTIE